MFWNGNSHLSKLRIHLNKLILCNCVLWDRLHLFSSKRRRNRVLIWHSQLSSPPKAHVKNFSEFGGLDGNAIEDVFFQIFVWDNIDGICTCLWVNLWIKSFVMCFLFVLQMCLTLHVQLVCSSFSMVAWNGCTKPLKQQDFHVQVSIQRNLKLWAMFCDRQTYM